MKSVAILLLFIMSWFLTACSSTTPELTMTPVEMIMPSPVPTEIILPTASNTNRPPTQTPLPSATKTPAKPLTPTQATIKSESNLDFSKYGPIAFIDNANVDEYTIRLLHPDGTIPDWSFKSNLLMHDLAWSPDGKFIAISTTYDSINILNFENQSLNKINLDESKWDFTIIENAFFSPDGKSLVFKSHNVGSIFRVDIDGSDLVNLSPDGRYRNPYEDPSWSPSGKQILYSREYVGGQIYSMNTDGSESRPLTTGGVNILPVFSPTGEWVGLIRSAGKNNFLYIMPSPSGPLKPLSDDYTNVVGYSWSPDGRYIVYSYLPEDENPQLLKYRIFEVDSGLFIELNSSWKTMKPAWSPIMNTAPIRQDCTDGWTRLSIGGFVHNPAGESPNRVRAVPISNATIEGQFLAGETYILLDGPVCVDNLVFWEIADPRLPGGSGWTAEGDGSEYWLEPLSP